MTEKQVFTGRTRARRPKRSVLVTDRVARWVISLGGIGSIAAVSMVGLFLLYVVIPLFRAPQVPQKGAFAAGETTSPSGRGRRGRASLHELGLAPGRHHRPAPAR